MCDSSVTEALLLTATRLPACRAGFPSPAFWWTSSSSPAGRRRSAIAFANDGSEHISAAVVSPIRYPVAAEQAEALLNALSSFRLGTREAEASAATRAAYGLDDPELTVWLHQAAGVVSTVDESGQFTTVDVAEQSLQFVIGRPEGDFFYTCEYAGECYLISRFLIENAAGRHAGDAGSPAPGEPGRRGAAGRGDRIAGRAASSDRRIHRAGAGQQ